MRHNAIAILLLVATACPGSSSSGPDGAPSGGTLAGNWLITGPAGPGQEMATLNWSTSSTTISFRGTTVALTRSGDSLAVNWTDSGSAPVVVNATHSGGANVGAIPFNPTGDWIFSSANTNDSTRCNTSFTSDTLTNSCTGLNSVSALDLPSFDGTVTAHRTQTGSSIFGDLGGTWNVGIGASGNCVVTFTGGTFQATCTNAGLLSGAVSVTIAGDIASGMIAGTEFSAQRQ